MTRKELQNIVEDIGVKIDALTRLQQTIAATVGECRVLAIKTEALLQSVRKAG